MHSKTGNDLITNLIGKIRIDGAQKEEEGEIDERHENWLSRGFRKRGKGRSE